MKYIYLLCYGIYIGSHGGQPAAPPPTLCALECTQLEFFPQSPPGPGHTDACWYQQHQDTRGKNQLQQLSRAGQILEVSGATAAGETEKHAD